MSVCDEKFFVTLYIICGPRSVTNKNSNVNLACFEHHLVVYFNKMKIKFIKKILQKQFVHICSREVSLFIWLRIYYKFPWKTSIRVRSLKPFNSEEMVGMLAYFPDFTSIAIDNGHSSIMPGRILEMCPIACVLIPRVSEI